MATIPQVKPQTGSTKELATEMRRAVEGHFDESGLTDAERESKYASLERSLNERDASRAKS